MEKLWPLYQWRKLFNEKSQVGSQQKRNRALARLLMFMLIFSTGYIFSLSFFSLIKIVLIYRLEIFQNERLASISQSVLLPNHHFSHRTDVAHTLLNTANLLFISVLNIRHI